MVSFVREKKWMNDGLSVVRRGPDNASEVCAKWRDHKMSGFGPPAVGTSRVRLAFDGFALVALQVHHAVRARELAAADGSGPLRPAVGHHRHHIQTYGTNLVVVAEEAGQIELRCIASFRI